MKVLVISGANLNMLGIREPEIYGNKTYKDLCSYIKKEAKILNIKVYFYQNNIEGKIVDKIQKARNKYDYIIINAGGYSHTSVVIRDAIKAINKDVIEVHLSDVNQREEFRKNDLLADVCKERFMGEGFISYKKALEYLSKR